MFGRRAGLSTCFSDVRCTDTVGSSDFLDLAIGAAKSDAAKSKASRYSEYSSGKDYSMHEPVNNSRILSSRCSLKTG